MTASELKEIYENREFEYIGIRVEDGIEYEIGDYANDSRVWVNGDPMDETLNGTCCIGINGSNCAKALELANSYVGNRVYIIGGDSMEFGEDEGEYIIRNAVVIWII